MPLYTYQCNICSKKHEAFRRVDNRLDSPLCCGVPTAKQVEAPIVRPDLEGYTSPIDGRWIEGKKARMEDLKRNDCIPYDEDFKKEVISKQDKLRDDTEKAIDRIVEETAAEIGFTT